MVRLVIAVRVVAPVGRPTETVDALVADGLQPLLEQFDSFPGLSLAFSAGVPVWEQLDRRHPEVASRVGELIGTGQIEPLGGPACDVVLAAVPGRDRIGQVKAQGEWLETRWGVRPTCGWVPHQIWEPMMADDLVEAELESVILLPDPTEKSRSRRSIRSGWFYTESDGRLLGVLPADETLAELVADGRVDDLPDRFETSRQQLGAGPVVVATLWGGDRPSGRPLVRLLKWLAAGDGWDLVTPSTALEQTESRGRYSLPEVGKTGGLWRLERDRDPVASNLHARLLDVSRRIVRPESASGDFLDPAHRAARWGLYRAQGAAASELSGVPRPEALAEARRLLLEAERLADRLEDRQAGWVDVMAEDFSLDGRTEVRLQSERLTAWIDPVAGRGLHELELRDIGLSLPLLTGHAGDGTSGGPPAWLLKPGADRESFIDGSSRLVSVAPREGQFTLTRPGGSAWLIWESDDEAGGPRMDWRIGMEAGEGGRLLFKGCVAGLEPRTFHHLAIEMPLGTGSKDDCYGYDRQGRRHDLESINELSEGDWVGLIEEQTGVDWSLGWSPATPAWRVRGAATELIVPHWNFQADEDGRWEFRVELTVDTSAAQARQLGRAA